MECKYCNTHIKGNKGALARHESTCRCNGDSLYLDEKIFVCDSTFPRHRLKYRIITYDMIPYKCAICGINNIWQDKPMPLILDHINGKNNDNRLENLRFVCSNCDSQLATYKSRNRRK